MPGVAGRRDVASMAAALSTSAFHVTVTVGAGRACLWLEGELDLDGVGELDCFVHLAGRAQLPCTVDCGGLTFIDVSGIGALLRAHGSGCTVRHLPPFALRLLDLLDLSEELLGPVPVAA